MRKPKENDNDKNKVNLKFLFMEYRYENVLIVILKLNKYDFNHMFLSYTVEGAEKAMKMRAKSGKNKKKQSKK